MRMRKRRIFPATWPSTVWSLSSRTRNIAFGRASITSPSSSTLSSLDMVAAPYHRRGRDWPSWRGGRELLAGGGLRPAALVAVAVALAVSVVARDDLGRRLVGARRVLRRAVLGSRRRRGRGAGAGRGRPGHAGRVGAGGRRRVAGGRARAATARPAVLAEERGGLEGRRGLLELAAEAALGRLHVGAPDRRGHLAARRALAERAPLARMPDPDRGRERRRVADEPGVGEVVDRAGLARRGAADLRFRAGARLHVLLEDL